MAKAVASPAGDSYPAPGEYSPAHPPSPNRPDFASDPLETPRHSKVETFQDGIDSNQIGGLTRALKNEHETNLRAAKHAEVQAAEVAKAVVSWQKTARAKAAAEIDHRGVD